MQSRQTQQHGFTLIINMAQSTWKSFDLRLLNKFAAELQVCVWIVHSFIKIKHG